MRIHLIVALCCVLGIRVTRSQHKPFGQYPVNSLRVRYPALRQSINQQLGPIHFHGVLGQVPTKYFPLTPADELATSKALSIVPDLPRFISSVHTLNRAGPINVDLPDFWLRGKLYLSKLVVRGVNQVQAEKLEIRTRNNRVDFVIDAPHVSADIQFELDGTLGVVPIFLSGTISVTPQDMKPAGAVGVKKVLLPGVGEVFQLDSGDVVLDVQSITINIDNVGDVDADVDLLKKQVVGSVRDLVADTLLRFALDEINKDLAKLPAAKVQAFLTNTY